MRQILQNETANLLQKLITNCVRFLLQSTTILLENAIVITRCDDLIIKCNSYYKMRQYKQSSKLNRELWSYGISCVPK